ncbi:hemerythrin domain-containing protein [Curvibacter sp. APW13]|uniref:hemerythrin domain-containing protein n=1 Tax=Curvibacter sp. APW13 TaxID=3077236 RepID=UPI0028DE8C71|nr:hemerythrin domain-containing protein [Curvibacter sp. APW13]MDT8991981.1 hemerythrin domain-containing protein [Curvibacter sp. APW13]
MAKLDTPPPFDALDACHRQIQQHLVQLGRLAHHVVDHGIDDSVRQQAQAVEAFFSGTSRQHHAQEEATVFPALLASGNDELAAAVRSLQQDHGWIEENWIELAPRLRALASGNGWIDEMELLGYAEVFLELMNDHIALEESLIYPESKAQWAQALAARERRMEALRHPD